MGKWLLHVYVIWMKLYVLIILLFWRKKEQSMLRGTPLFHHFCDLRKHTITFCGKNLWLVYLCNLMRMGFVIS